VYYFWSKFYDNFVDFRYKFDRRKVIEKLNIKNRDNVLEIGVGTGLNLPFYPKNCTVYGVDFSKFMLEKAKEKKSNVNIILQNMDARNLKFQDNFFDKVLMTYILRVTPEPVLVLKEIIRVLKPKGTLIIFDQFKIKNSFFIKKLIRFLIGSGKDYYLEDLIQNIPFTIKSKERHGTRKGSYIYVLEKNS